jgi:hypothetical protein
MLAEVEEPVHHIVSITIRRQLSWRELTTPHREPVARLGPRLFIDALEALVPDIPRQCLWVQRPHKPQQVRPAENPAEVDAHAHTQRQRRRHVGDAYCCTGLSGETARDADCVEVGCHHVFLESGLPGVAVIGRDDEDLASDQLLLFLWLLPLPVDIPGRPL